VGLEPRLWTSRFLAKLSLDSDDILCAQLLADTWLELLDLPLITPKDRRRRILDRIMTMNFHTHSPAVGAANLVGRLGQTLDAAQAQDVWIGIQFGLVAALISADMRKEALEILDICYRNLYEKIRIPFAVPEGFNGNSALTAADLAYAMKLKTDEAEQLIAALTEHSIVEKNGRVSADVKTVTLKKLKTMLQQGSGLKILNHKQYLELLGLLHSWGLRYSAGRYHRPGMAYCILDMLARKSQESTQHPL